MIDQLILRKDATQLLKGLTTEADVGLLCFQFNGLLLDDQYFKNEDVEVVNTGKFMEVRVSFGLVVKFDGDRKLITTLPETYKEQVKQKSGSTLERTDPICS